MIDEEIIKRHQKVSYAQGMFNGFAIGVSVMSIAVMLFIFWR